ncbi:tRNA (adenosine(37)-N6)-threonylcarbamoyltransferase complex transferase subunit TsaD [Candidatus Berkelbacteria bacterium]|nr:tRNA (adenosine(37)-N6)-threonylcarbamoyltransferase complex transferase subunit TsaD [Candidatus Berkelbacteria bacterium]
MSRILAIETSCDETAAAVVEGDAAEAITVRSNSLASQAALHTEFGGVFPDLAAREHTKRIVPVIGLALHESGLLDDPEARGEPVQRALSSIDAIAVTVGPGLIGPLLIGTAAASQLANLTQTPIVPVNHWEGHIYSAFIGRTPQFPLLILTVSGGHTSLFLMRDHFRYELLGSTIDDAAGEAFDKTARMLGLGYPGGAALSNAAAKARIDGQTIAVQLPRPMLKSGDLRMSFSGLKTAVRYAIDRGDIQLPGDVGPAAAAIEDAIVDVLLAKLQQAAEQAKPANIAIVGGVSANTELRRRSHEQFGEQLIIPDFAYCTDNAAMIGAAGLVRFLKGEGVSTWRDIHANAALRLGVNRSL